MLGRGRKWGAWCRVLGLLLGSLLLVACATNRSAADAPRNPEIPAGSLAGLRPGDSVEISLQSIPDPSQVNVQLDDEGAVSLRFVGRIEAGGLTPSQLAERIERAYVEGRFYPSLDVAVVIAERFVYLAGEVRQPGPVRWQNNLTLTQAVAAAGGFAIYARENAVQVNRETETYFVDAVLAVERPSEDVRLLPGDTVFVPRSAF